MKLIIDARESGTSTGRYIDKLIENLCQLRPEFNITVLTKTPRIEYIKSIAPSFDVLPSDYKEFTFAEQLGFKRQLNGLQADLIHFNAPQQPVLYSGRTVTTVHDLTTARFNNPSKNWLVFKFKQLVYRIVVKRVARKSKALITPSQFVKDDLVNFAHVEPNKITVTYEAADKITEPAKPVGNLQLGQFIMYVGRPTPHKNLERLVEAFKIISQNKPDLKLVLAGKTDANYQRLQKLVNKQNLTSQVIFTGYADNGQLRWLYENCGGYVFPSLSEGFGLPGLEAMAHGAPVVSSNATCLPEIYGNAAHYFDPLSVDDIAAKIYEVLDNSKLRSDLISAGAKQAAQYSWRRMAGQTLEVYRAALKN